MKTIRLIILICAIAISNKGFSVTTYDTTADSTGLPGDNFSLHGALDMFKKSTSLEEFEKKLNDDENGVNNLDLNNDGEIDYVQVIDKTEGNAHAIVLQVSVTETESQDVAVIEIEKNGDASAMLQIIGDEELYEANTIVEPYDETDLKNGKSGPMLNDLMTRKIIVNVWIWPCVKFIYAPAYVVWVSPWHWHYYPVWWKPWKPHPWYWHHRICGPYRMLYKPTNVHRVMIAHKMYAPHRKSSVVVATRFKAAHVNHTMNKTRKETAKPIKTKSAVGNNIKTNKNGNAQKANKGGGMGAPHPKGGNKGGKGGKGGRK